MPIYEYRCKACEKTFSRIQKMDAGSEGVTCPSCESQQVERQVSSFASTSSGNAPSPSAHTCGSGFT
jgi:putative FmdB family regulatory protein